MIDAKDREIWVGENRIYLSEDNVLCLTIIGEIDEEIEIGINQACLKLANMVEGKANLLVDLNRCGKTSPGARRRQKEFSEHEKIGKGALFGIHPVARVLASFFLGNTNKKDVNFFKTREEALAWLKEEK
jgi:hypothetical protein